jgi:transcription antitermination factor NusG
MQSDAVEGQVSKDITAGSWFAVYTKHQHEKAASDFLAQKGFEVLLPLYRAKHRWKDRTKIVFLPVFPCYLFLRANLDRKTDILRTPGVFWLVENGGRACEVPESDIDAIRKITRSTAHIEPHPFLKCGELVRVRSGPLTGVTGILTRVKNNYRVVLSVDLLQQAVAMEVDLSIVEPIDPSSRRTPLQLLESRSLA